jgi:hypothetical protein
MATRATGAIALRPTDNKQGGYYFFSLTTGRVRNQNRLTKLPMPSKVIDRAHILARRGPSGGLGLVFGNRNGSPTITNFDDTDDSNDKSYRPLTLTPTIMTLMSTRTSTRLMTIMAPSTAQISMFTSLIAPIEGVYDAAVVEDDDNEV